MQSAKFSQRLLFILGISLLSASAINGQTSAPREISLIVTVTDDDGRLFSGLEREWFSIFEKSTQLRITSFETSEKPTSVVFLFDLSASISIQFKNAAAEAAYRFVQKSNSDNDYLVLSFDKEINSIGNWIQSPQAIKPILTEILQHTPNHNTALYDACDVALRRLETSKYSTHVLVLFSDGQDNVSKLTFKGFREELKRSSTTLYAIDWEAKPSSMAMEGSSVIDELASVSGGRAYYPRNDKELQDVLDQISLELSHHYTIAFSPPSATPTKEWQVIKVKLTLPARDEKGHKFPHLNVQSRQGYY